MSILLLGTSFLLLTVSWLQIFYECICDSCSSNGVLIDSLIINVTSR